MPVCSASCADSPFFFIGHESPEHLPSLQQSQSRQQDFLSVFSLSFFFIGQESPLQEHAAVADGKADLEYANAANESAKRATTANASMNLLFMIFPHR
jgi:hypothetical protein